MKKRLLPVTPDIYKEIKRIAYALPQVPKFDKHGKPVYQVDGKRLKGSELPAGTKVNGKDVDPEKQYVQTKPKMVPQNHEVALVDAFQQFGMDGIKSYCKSVEDWIEKVNAHKQALKDASKNKQA